MIPQGEYKLGRLNTWEFIENDSWMPMSETLRVGQVFFD